MFFNSIDQVAEERPNAWYSVPGFSQEAWYSVPGFRPRILPLRQSQADRRIAPKGEVILWRTVARFSAAPVRTLMGQDPGTEYHAL
jgi:hypothetical protein